MALYRITSSKLAETQVSNSSIKTKVAKVKKNERKEFRNDRKVMCARVLHRITKLEE